MMSTVLPTEDPRWPRGKRATRCARSQWCTRMDGPPPHPPPLLCLFHLALFALPLEPDRAGFFAFAAAAAFFAAQYAFIRLDWALRSAGVLALRFPDGFAVGPAFLSDVALPVLAENPASLWAEVDDRRRQRILNDHLQHSDRGSLSVMEKSATSRDRRPSFRDEGTSLRHPPLLHTVSCGRGCSK
jgi:hypothetical protein